jgi:dipeptide/tripeptide permease
MMLQNLILIWFGHAANETFEKVASFGLIANMILYLINEYHMDTVTGLSVLFMWSAVSHFTPVIGAFLSDSYLGRFRMIAYGTAFSLLVSFFFFFFFSSLFLLLLHLQALMHI